MIKTCIFGELFHTIFIYNWIMGTYHYFYPYRGDIHFGYFVVTNSSVSSHQEFSLSPSLFFSDHKTTINMVGKNMYELERFVHCVGFWNCASM